MEQNTNRFLCEFPTATVQEINLLKEWISKQPHLPQQHDDKWLESFLVGCKFSVERCKKVFDNFYTVRSRFPQYFLNVDPASQDIKKIVQVYYHITLPDTHEGCSIIMRGILDADESKLDKKVMCCRELLTYNWLLKTKSNPAIVVAFDMRGLCLGHASKNIAAIKILLYILQDALPFHFKEIHVIYANSLLKKVLFMITPFLKEKLRNRIHIHTDDLSTFYKFIPQELLPNEYGGKAGTIKQLNDENQKALEDMKDVLIEEYKKKTDESKRIKDNTDNELFGVDGSFKVLNID